MVGVQTLTPTGFYLRLNRQGGCEAVERPLQFQLSPMVDFLEPQPRAKLVRGGFVLVGWFEAANNDPSTREGANPGGGAGI